MTTLCRSGRHAWLDPRHALYCCNGYHLKLRALGDYHGVEPDAPRIVVHGEPPFMKVWVKDGPERGTAEEVFT